MCGIAGVLDHAEEKSAVIVAKMNEHLSHRGPDAKGIFTAQNISLGHRRLSILDIDQRSNQPFIDPSDRYVLVFNGEIYNYQDIKKELNHYVFITNSDTEVLLAAFITWGTNCLKKLNGMFAFAIWDKKEKSLFITRDRLGIKPLYYSTENGFVFGSEIRSILETGLVSRKLDADSVYEFLSNQSIQAPNTIIKGLQQLEPGKYGIYKNRILEIKEYWNLAASIPEQEFSNTSISDIRACLTRSVERRMISDVPLGAFLSGGIDSSAIVGLMAEVSTKKIQTFSMGFNEEAYDESYYAKLISKRFSTSHQAVKITPADLLSKIPDILGQMDTPSADGINSYLISEATKQSGLKVALSGLGGDELFAGYPVFKQLPKALQNPVLKSPQFMKAFLSPIIEQLMKGNKKTKMLNLLSTKRVDFENLYPIFRKIASDQEVRKLLNDHQQVLNIKSSKASLLDITANISVAELKTYTSDVLLKDIDQMSMAHALEVRVPLLDHVLVEKVLSIPETQKFNNSPKSLLTTALKDLLPDEIINRKKQGFALPWEHWLRNELSEFTNKQLLKLKRFDVFDYGEIDRLWSGFLKGNPNVHWSRIWTLCILGFWLDQHLD